MRIDILTLFPEMFDSVLSVSILGRAREKGLIATHCHNIRDYSDSKHHNADDYPFGGGAGMVMMPQPILSCLDAVDPAHTALRVALVPRGRALNAALVRQLAEREHLLLLCGHYEGIDERAMDEMDMEISIGDYVLTGGELPAMVLIDSVSRFIPGVLGSADSAEEESFTSGLLEYPHYTRPAEFLGKKVPEVLLNGNHAHIARWRREQSLRLTLERRSELLAGAQLDKKDQAYLERLRTEK